MNEESHREQQIIDRVQETRFHKLDVQPVGFSRIWTAMSTVILMTGIGLLIWSYDSLTSIEHVENPERALSHIVSRSMDLEESLALAPTWEQALHQVLNGDEDSSKQFMTWYEELVNESADPLASLYAAVLEGESGNLVRLKERVEMWEDLEKPYPLYQDLLETAYVEKFHNQEELTVLQARLAEEVPGNWFYDRLAIRIAQQAQDSSFVRLTQDHRQGHLENLFFRNRVLMVAQVCAALMSVVALVILLWLRHRKGSEVFLVSHAWLPPPWVGWDGFTVLMRGGAVTFLLLSGLGAFLGAYLSFVDNTLNAKLMELSSALILYTPIPILMYYYFLYPKRQSVRHVFGFQLHSGKTSMLILTVLSLFAGGLLGDLLMSVGGDAVGKSIHWTEWFNDSLVWGSPGDLAILFLEVAVLAPIFEEFIFRGIVYASLRRRFSWLISAVISAAIFSIVHGYGIIGFGAVWWSGFLWAWAYEKTGSLWPGIAAHALNNSVFLMSLLVIFR